MGPRWALLGTLISLGCAVACPQAGAATIVYAKGGDIWLMNPDGSGQHRVTHAGVFSGPTQADDGTILAQIGGDSGNVVRLDQYGHELSPPVETAVTGGGSGPTDPYSSWVALHGPFDPVISPDGVTFAYWGGGTVNEYNAGCNCTQADTHSFVRYGNPRTFDEPSSQEIGQEDYAYPSYIDAHTLLMSMVGVFPLVQDVAVYTLGTGGNHMTQWFSDTTSSQHPGSPDVWSPNSEGMSSGVMNRQKTLMAFVVGVTDQTTNQTSEELRIYAITAALGDSQHPPSLRCAYFGPAGGHFYYPSFSPDGGHLAWGEGDGIHVGAVGNLSTCAGFTDTLIAPGGTHPAFGPSGLRPAPCTVPNVKGKTLPAARQALSAAHCATGAVSTPRKPRRKPPRGKRWKLFVASQSPAPGSLEPSGTRVRLKLVYRAVRTP